MEVTKYSPFEQSLLRAIRDADDDLFRFFQMGTSGDEPFFDLLHISESQRKYAPSRRNDHANLKRRSGSRWNTKQSRSQSA